MNKQEFLAELRKRLSGLPQADIEERIVFYSEMIDDRTEEGSTEEEAVSAIGFVNDVVSQIFSETPLTKLVKEKVKPNRALKAWEIALLILGSPIWLPLLLAAAIIVLAVYIVIWSVIITLYAVDLTFAAGGIAGIAAILTYIANGNVPGALLFFGAGFVSAGLAILLFFGFNQITKYILLLSRKFLLNIKALFIRKGEVQ